MDLAKSAEGVQEYFSECSADNVVDNRWVLIAKKCTLPERLLSKVLREVRWVTKVFFQFWPLTDKRISTYELKLFSLDSNSLASYGPYRKACEKVTDCTNLEEIAYKGTPKVFLMKDHGYVPEVEICMLVPIIDISKVKIGDMEILGSLNEAEKTINDFLEYLKEIKFTIHNEVEFKYDVAKAATAFAGEGEPLKKTETSSAVVSDDQEILVGKTVEFESEAVAARKKTAAFGKHRKGNTVKGQARNNMPEGGEKPEPKGILTRDFLERESKVRTLSRIVKDFNVPRGSVVYHAQRFGIELETSKSTKASKSTNVTTVSSLNLDGTSQVGGQQVGKVGKTGEDSKYTDRTAASQVHGANQVVKVSNYRSTEMKEIEGRKFKHVREALTIEKLKEDFAQAYGIKKPDDYNVVYLDRDKDWVILEVPIQLEIPLDEMDCHLKVSFQSKCTNN